MLTSMATLQALSRGPTPPLAEFELPEDEDRCPIRPFFVATAIFDIVDGDARYYDGSIKEGGRTPLDHLQQLFCDHRCAVRPRVGELRRLQPTRDGVWKAHPPLLRVFGWCWALHSFLPVSVALEADLKADKTLYDDHLRGVLDFIKMHKLQDLVLRGDALAIFPPQT